MYRPRSCAFFLGSVSLFGILVPTCYAVFINCDQMFSFFSWHLLNQWNTYLFALASFVQIGIPFRAAVIGMAEAFGPADQNPTFNEIGSTVWFLAQTAVFSCVAALLGKATFSLDYVTATSQFVWPTRFLPGLL